MQQADTWRRHSSYGAEPANAAAHRSQRFFRTSVLFVVAMLMKNASSYNTITGIVAALAGFVTGVFLPIGVFPERLQRVFALIPAHHGATLIQSVMIEATLARVFQDVSD